MRSGGWIKMGGRKVRKRDEIERELRRASQNRVRDRNRDNIDRHQTERQRHTKIERQRGKGKRRQW